MLLNGKLKAELEPLGANTGGRASIITVWCSSNPALSNPNIYPRLEVQADRGRTPFPLVGSRVEAPCKRRDAEGRPGSSSSPKRVLENDWGKAE